LHSRLARILDIRQGEGIRTVLMFATILLLIAAYTVTKTVRDAVFLSKFGLRELSYMMIGIAIVAGFVVSGYKRATSGVGRNVVSIITNGCIAVTLVFMALGLSAHLSWLSWALYFWSGLFGLVLVAEFWLLANDLFNAREAKRLFPIIGSGAILGGFLGGALSGWLAKPLGSANLLYIVAAMLVAAAALSHVAWKRRRPEVKREQAETPTPRFAEGLAILRRNGYVRLIALMLVCMTVCMTIVQWQYKGIAKIHFNGRQDDMTAFFGTLAAVLNLASFALQLVGTPRLLKRFGVGVGLHVLPAGFGLGALALLATTLVPLPMLGAAAVAVLFSDGFRFSVDKASTELLYLPIPRSVKDQAKPFIDTFVDRASGALAGFLWLALDWLFHVDRADRIVYAAVATLVTLGIWLVIIARARKSYVDAYRGMLGLPVPAPRGRVVDPQLIASVRAELVGLDTDGDMAAQAKRLRSIARLTRKVAVVGLDIEAITPHLAREAEIIRLLTQAIQAEMALVPASDKRPPLVKALQVRLRLAIARTFQLLALVYPRADVTAAERALIGESYAARAGALELLDNMLRGEARAALLEALDHVALPPGRERAEARPMSREQALLALMALPDVGLRRDVARAARDEGRMTPALRRVAASDCDAQVRRAADVALPSPLTLEPQPGYC
jgi:ATP/ADP translocase